MRGHILGYWKKSTRPLINAPFLEDLFDGLVIIDGGAANEIFEPANSIERGAKIYCFEPNSEAPSYKSSVPVRKLGSALWNKRQELMLHIAAEPSTSSVYPPNKEILEMFPDKIGWPARRTVSTERIPGCSIDDMVEAGECEKPDLIKLDVHSSEYESLIGASLALKTASAVLVETWHWDIHKGQKLHGDVEKFLNNNDFYLYDLRKASSWKEESPETIKDRGILVGSESVFFRRTPIPGKELGLVILLDLFGFTASAINHTAAEFPRETAQRIIGFIRESNRARLFEQSMHRFAHKARQILSSNGLFEKS